MAVTFSNPSNGTAMVAATITGLLDDAFEFVNGGVGRNDVTGELGFRHLYRPEVGFDGRSEGQLQEAASHNVVGDPWRLDTRRQRVDIFPDSMPVEGWVKVPGMEWTGYIPNGAHVDVLADWSAEDVHDTATSSVAYPTEAGYFVVGYRDRSTGTVSFIGHTRRELHAPETFAATAAKQRYYNTYGYKTIGVSGGRVYDFFLAYNNSGAHASMHQVVVGHRSFLVEVLKDGGN